MHQLVRLGMASKNPLEVIVQVPECTGVCNVFFSTKPPPYFIQLHR